MFCPSKLVSSSSMKHFLLLCWPIDAAGSLFFRTVWQTDRWVHFQQNAGLRLFVHTWIVHGIGDCYRLTQTSEGIFCPVFFQAVLERVHCSAAYKFIWQDIPSSCIFNSVKVLGNWCVEMFYNKNNNKLTYHTICIIFNVYFQTSLECYIFQLLPYFVNNSLLLKFFERLDFLSYVLCHIHVFCDLYPFIHVFYDLYPFIHLLYSKLLIGANN